MPEYCGAGLQQSYDSIELVMWPGINDALVRFNFAEGNPGRFTCWCTVKAWEVAVRLGKSALSNALGLRIQLQAWLRLNGYRRNNNKVSGSNG